MESKQNPKEVRYDIYCKTCKYQFENQGDDPCNGCLDTPFRPATKQPLKYEKVQENKRPFRFRRKNKPYNRNK